MTEADIKKLRSECNLVTLLTSMAPDKNKASLVGQWLMMQFQIFPNDPELDFALIESQFRELDSHIFLVALPPSAYDPKSTVYFGEGSADQKQVDQMRTTEVKTWLPSRKEAPYNWLFICVNGQLEAIDILMKNNLTAVKNKINLKDCGFLAKEK